MRLEEILGEIRKGRRWRFNEGPWKSRPDNDCARMMAIAWQDLDSNAFELEPEPEVIEVPRGGKHDYPYKVSKDGYSPSPSVLLWPLSEIDALKIAADKVRGIAPNYQSATESNGLGSKAMSAEEAWEKYEKSVSGDPYWPYEPKREFLDAFTLGQQSQPVVEYVEPDLGHYSTSASPTYDKGYLAGHITGWEAREAAMKGGQ
jgi:hypothetical protein